MQKRLKLKRLQLQESWLKKRIKKKSKRILRVKKKRITILRKTIMRVNQESLE